MSIEIPTDDVAAAVVLRDRWTCVACGDPLAGVRGHGWSIHARRELTAQEARAGSHMTPANFIAVCGVGHMGCAGIISRTPEAHQPLGLVVPAPRQPTAIPVMLRDRRRPDRTQRVYLTTDGRRVPIGGAA
jgi:hypothetical protein